MAQDANTRSFYKGQLLPNVMVIAPNEWDIEFGGEKIQGLAQAKTAEPKGFEERFQNIVTTEAGWAIGTVESGLHSLFNIAHRDIWTKPDEATTALNLFEHSRNAYDVYDITKRRQRITYPVPQKKSGGLATTDLEQLAATNIKKCDEISESLMAITKLSNRLTTAKAAVAKMIAGTWEAVERARRVAEAQLRLNISGIVAPPLGETPAWFQSAKETLRTPDEDVDVSNRNAVESAELIARCCAATDEGRAVSAEAEKGPMGAVTFSWNIGDDLNQWTIAPPRVQWPAIEVSTLSIRSVNGQMKAQTRFFCTANELLDYFKGACRGSGAN